MPLTDLPLSELREYRPDVAEPADFDAFWRRTLDEARGAGGDVTLVPAETPITQVIIEDLTFPGFGGDPVRAWVTRPWTDERLPVVIEYVGYGGGRGLAGERLFWANAGYVHVLMDTRGQGSVWGSGGDTPDPHGSGPATSGYMTRGIDHPDTHYYRRVFTDAVRLVDAVSAFDFVDPARIAVTGGSQGGAITLAAAALHPAVRAAMPDVPFLCQFRRSVELTPQAPFTEVATYLSVHRDRVEQVFETLSYLDGVNFARRISAPALFSVGMMDPVVLPSTVFAAYNHLGTDDAEIAVYEFNAHEGGGTYQQLRQAAWLSTRI